VIAYFDASALVKRHVDEQGSREAIAFAARAEVVATSVSSRAAVAAALAKAVRVRLLEEQGARAAQRAFAAQWLDIARIPVTEALVSRAETLAWEHGLRGYDALQLASAVLFQESVGTNVRLATFDRQLWDAARRTGFEPWPEKLPHRAR
jgi:predicted nucleic acid-binding protein